MDQSHLDDLFVDANVPGLSKQGNPLPAETRKTCLRILRQAHRLANDIVSETGGEAVSDPQQDQAVHSCLEAAIHGIAVVVGGA